MVKKLESEAEGRGFESDPGHFLRRRAGLRTAGTPTWHCLRSQPPHARRVAVAPFPRVLASHWRGSQEGTPRSGTGAKEGDLATANPGGPATGNSPSGCPVMCDWTQCAASPAVGPIPQRALPRGRGPLRIVLEREHAGGAIADAPRACGDLAPGGLRARGGLAPGDASHREGSGPGTAPRGPFSPIKRDPSHRPVGRIPGSGDSSQQPWHASPACGRGPQWHRSQKRLHIAGTELQSKLRKRRAISSWSKTVKNGPSDHEEIARCFCDFDRKYRDFTAIRRDLRPCSKKNARRVIKQRRFAPQWPRTPRTSSNPNCGNTALFLRGQNGGKTAH